MSRSLIIKKIKAKYPKLSITQIEEMLDLITNILRESAINNKSIEIRDFGTFWIKNLSERKSGRNPKTGEQMYIPQKNKLRFKASKLLRNFINKD